MPDFVGKLSSGLVGTGQALAGKVAVRAIPDAIGLQKSGNVGLAIQLVTALLVSAAADRFVSEEAGQFVLVGGLMSPVEELVKGLNIPVVSPALSGYHPALGRYVPSAGGRLGRYVQPAQARRRAGAGSVPQAMMM